MRIQDPQIGLISPGEFIPAAEHTGLVTQLSAIMLRKVCRFLVEHDAAAQMLSYVSINISADDFASQENARKLVDIIVSSGIDPRRIGFEVTESMLLSANKTVETTWHMFTGLGVLLMLDDFGTGYSNLETLMKLPFTVVKIDRSVVSNSRNNFELITLISVMLERLGKQMVAEDVDTREQLEFVQAAGVDLVQGYYFSKPLGEEDFLACCVTRKPSDRSSDRSVILLIPICFFYILTVVLDLYSRTLKYPSGGMNIGFA